MKDKADISQYPYYGVTVMTSSDVGTGFQMGFSQIDKIGNNANIGVSGFTT